MIAGNFFWWRFAGKLRSGGTRIRTGDTMIFSHMRYRSGRFTTCRLSAYMSHLVTFCVHVSTSRAAPTVATLLPSPTQTPKI
jgi:hypothetical protein